MNRDTLALAFCLVSLLAVSVAYASSVDKSMNDAYARYQARH